MIKLINIISYIKNELKNIYNTNETKSFISIILKHFLSYSSIDIVLKSENYIDETKVNTIKNVLTRLKKHEPIQYILGYTEFYGLNFSLNKHVLIPRPETEELVEWIIKDNINVNKSLEIIDIGTGSGCIPISISKNLELAKIQAIEISKEAIEIAKINAIRNNVIIDFKEYNILKYADDSIFLFGKYDIIVSNPPYVRYSEKKMMQKNVLNYEPPIALFVEDDNPFVFYEKIALFAKNHLNENANLYFEINEYLHNELSNILYNIGFSNIVVKKDISGKHRMIRAKI